MLSNEELNKYKSLVEAQEKAKQTEQELRAQLKVYKTNSEEIFKKYGYKDFSDLPKLEADLNNLEASIKENEGKIVEYINYINEKKAEKDNILLG